MNISITSSNVQCLNALDALDLFLDRPSIVMFKLDAKKITN